MQSPGQQSTGIHGGYTPTSFDAPVGPHGAYVRPEVFYGSLIDMSTGRPTEVLCRMSDALFAFLDQNVEIPGLRRTGFMEPLKYGWLHRRLGVDSIICQAMEENVGTYYNTASIPYQRFMINDISTPVLDRRGFLHVLVYDARVDPEETHKDWQKYFAALRLVDPATNAPFPTPVPRSAFPSMADPQLLPGLQSWQVTLISKVAQARTNAQVAQILGPRNSGGSPGPPIGNSYLAQYQAHAQSQTNAQKRNNTIISVAKVAGRVASSLLSGGGSSGGIPDISSTYGNLGGGAYGSSTPDYTVTNNYFVGNDFTDPTAGSTEVNGDSGSATGYPDFTSSNVFNGS